MKAEPRELTAAEAKLTFDRFKEAVAQIAAASKTPRGGKKNRKPTK